MKILLLYCTSALFTEVTLLSVHFKYNTQLSTSLLCLCSTWKYVRIFNAHGQWANPGTNNHVKHCTIPAGIKGKWKKPTVAQWQSATQLKQSSLTNEHVIVEPCQSGGPLWSASTYSSCSPVELELICMRLFAPHTAAWSDALLIFLYEQLLALMKLGPMRRASSGRDRPHSSWFDSRVDTGALRWQGLSQWVAAAFLFALSTHHL